MEIVDDGKRGEEDLERARHPRADQGQHAKCKSDVGGGRNCPAAPILRMGKVDGHEDHRGDEHAAESRDQRKRPARPGIELALHHLPLDLEPDQEKEKGHQPIVDPMPQIEASDACM